MDPDDAKQPDAAVSIAMASLAYAITYSTACKRRFWVEARYVRAGSELRTKRTYANSSLSGATAPASLHDAVVEERKRAYGAEGYAMHSECEIFVPGTVPIQGRIDLLGLGPSDVVFEEVKAAAYDHQRGFTQVKLYEYYARRGYLVDVNLRDAVKNAPTTRRIYYSGGLERKSPVLALNVKDKARADAAIALAYSAIAPSPAPSYTACRFCIADAERCDKRVAPFESP